MKKVLLVTPVYERFALTEILLRHRLETFSQADVMGVQCDCIVIGDDANCTLAEDLGFFAIEAPNVLGRKYNDGHEFAVTEGYDFSFHCNSDQVFDSVLLKAIADSPDDQMVKTHWMMAVHESGRKCISYRNRRWAMQAFPVPLLANNPRPCRETATSMCDTEAHQGVAKANPTATEHFVDVGPGETIQFESDMQMHPWDLHKYRGQGEMAELDAVPWNAIDQVYGENLVNEMQGFYGLLDV